MKRIIINYLFILFGSSFLAFGIVAFLGPNNIATGGTAGLAIVFHSLFNVSISALFALINVPLLIVSIKYLGKKFALKSIIAISLIVIFIKVLEGVIKLEALSQEPLLVTLYGGVMIGLGLGLIFKGGGSAGGGSIIAKIICSKYPIKTGTVIFILDGLVVISSAIVFNSIELALWSMINIFVATKLIDAVLTGLPNEKVIHISSYKSLADLGIQINSSLNLTGTHVKGQDLSLQENKDIIFVTVPKNRINLLKQMVYSYDEDARMIVIDAAEMNGKSKELSKK